MSSNIDIDDSISNEESPLLGVPQGDANASSNSHQKVDTQHVDAPTSSSLLHKGRGLLLVVAFLYGSLSVSLRMVYARPGPPAASILSATRGWMTVFCLLPVILFNKCKSKKSESSSPTSQDPPMYSTASFYGFALELAVFNFGTQGLLNIGLLTTESARSAFFTQLSVVITPILAATIGFCSSKKVMVKPRVWMACFLALFGLYVLSSESGDNGVDTVGDVDGDETALFEEDGDTDDVFSWNLASITLLVSSLLHQLSFGDWCCLGSAFSWSYYIYRLSDWGDRYDEAQTMFVKNIFMAILYTSWTVASYIWTTHYAADANIDAIIDSETTETISGGSRSLWEGEGNAIEDDSYLWEGNTTLWEGNSTDDLWEGNVTGVISDIIVEDEGSWIGSIVSNLWEGFGHMWEEWWESDSDSSGSSFYLWEGWRDPIALSILFYTALSSGAISDILQQKAQSSVPAAESNVILSLEPVFAAILGLGLLAEIPSIRECVGGACIVGASILASST